MIGQVYCERLVDEKFIGEVVVCFFDHVEQSPVATGSELQAFPPYSATYAAEKVESFQIIVIQVVGFGRCFFIVEKFRYVKGKAYVKAWTGINEEAEILG